MTPKEVQLGETSKVPEQSATVADPSARDKGEDAEMMKDPTPSKKVDATVNMPPARSDDAADKTSLLPAKPADKKQRPEKLDIAAAKVKTRDDVGVQGVSTESAKANSKERVENSNAHEPSQPSTPATAASQASAMSAVRQNQPRTIRIPPVPKGEGSSPAFVPSSKQASRRASLVSVQRAGTPLDERMSDNVSLTSTSISRANSPPPSKVGSAPVRQITKSQQKKERQARAKQAEGPPKVEEPAAKVEEVHAPILGRKKKTKKERTKGTADSTPTVTRPTSPVPGEEAGEEKAVPVPVTPVKESKKGPSKAVADTKGLETPSSPATPATGEQLKSSLTPASLLASLLEHGEISPFAAELFKIAHPSLNHRYDPIEPDFPHIEPPTDEQLRLLAQGEAIEVARGPNHNVIVLPDGRQIPGLTPDQAARYIELRKSILSNEHAFAPQGLDGLIPPAPPGNRGPRTKQLVNKFADPIPQSMPTSIQKYGLEISTADADTPKKDLSLAELEARLVVEKKEIDVLEKKLNALAKKNRRLLFGNSH